MYVRLLLNSLPPVLPGGVFVRKKVGRVLALFAQRLQSFAWPPSMGTGHKDIVHPNRVSGNKLRACAGRSTAAEPIGLVQGSRKSRSQRSQTENCNSDNPSDSREVQICTQAGPKTRAVSNMQAYHNQIGIIGTAGKGHLCRSRQSATTCW